MISNLSKAGTKVWHEQRGFGIVCAKSCGDDEVFLVRFESGLMFTHRKQLTEMVEK